jgi:hypothetical protein
MSIPVQSDPKSHGNGVVWLVAGFVFVCILFACIAAVAAGGYLYFQSNIQARATPTLISIFAPSTPTRAPSTVVELPTTAPPTLSAPTIIPTTAPSPSPTSKCPPAPALPAGVLFSDDFASRQVSECNGWALTTGENVDYAWSENKYTISVKKKLWLGMTWPSSEYDNFGIETEAQPISDDYAEYGLVFRVTGVENARNYYFFGIRTDGKYFVYKQTAGKWSDADPVKITPAPSIKPGKNKNLIGVIAQGNTYALYINRVLVNTITDDSFVGKGKVGIIAGAGENNANASVVFSRLTVLTPDKAKAEWGSAPSSTQPPGAPGFSAVTFSTAFDDKTWTPINPGKVFPYGTKIVYAVWSYNAIAPNTVFEYEWLFNNVRVDSDTDRLPVSSGKSAQWLVHPRSEAFPLDRGNYQFNVRVGGQIVISDTFVIQ